MHRAHPKGVPSVTYCRVLPNTTNKTSDITIDGKHITVKVTGTNSSVRRYDLPNVIESKLNDDEVCETILGNKAGALGSSTVSVHTSTGEISFNLV